VSDCGPGIARHRRGKGFFYVAPDGKPVRDQSVLARIKSLAIPPAWEDVWICSDPDGHMQATGRDARGRKQHRYHPQWRTVRDETKFHRMVAFAGALPRIRRHVEQDLARPGLPREKILATVVRLLETTLIRIGHEEYARRNGSFGLATLRDRHVRINGSNLRFAFRGKSGVLHAVDLRNRRLAHIVRQSRDLPGYELFQYVDESGARRSIDASDVNDYIRQLAGDEFTAKDFRTWAGTVLAAQALREMTPAGSGTQAKRNLALGVATVAARLGNTKNVCRKCYIHPDIVSAYSEGRLEALLRRGGPSRRSPFGLSPDERAVLRLLEKRRGAAA
jgi:DNA topoisomerase-1